jgi:pyrroloquinoline quinone biosynthesis protein B
MRVRVLGAAAGGGFPQWNCSCPGCEEARIGRNAKPRTQDSVAVSASGAHGVDWFLLNASPDILAQLRNAPALGPRAPRRSPIRGIVLTNGDLDHCLGLFSLRESHPLEIYATEAVFSQLADENVIFRTLERFPGHTTWRRLELGCPMRLGDEDTKLEILALPAPGKLPIHLASRGTHGHSREQNIGVWVRDARSGAELAYVPSAAAIGELAPHLDEADCVLFDGTFWSSDEMIRLGVSRARAEDLAHMPVGGQGGSLDSFRWLRAPRKIYTHINNTNPMLIESSAERREVTRAGWEIAEDGMEIEL